MKKGGIIVSKKRIALICTSLALSAVVAVGGTLAYLTASATKTNTFTVGSDLTGILAEPNWDGGDPACTEPSLGQNIAKHVVPNLKIPKDPTVINTSDNQDAWVAIKLNCTYNGSSTNAYNAIFGTSGFATLDIDNNWEQSTTDPTILYYKVILPHGGQSATAFHNVQIKGDGITHDQLKNFVIDVNAYFVQSDTFDNAKTALHAGFSSVFPDQA